MKLLFLTFLNLATISVVLAGSPFDTPFPLENYDQRVNSWINPADPSYDQELLGSDIQQKRTAQLYDYLFGSLSPWNQAHVEAVLKNGRGIKSEEEQNFTLYNKAEAYYGKNTDAATPYPQGWLASIKENSNLSQFDSLSYHASNYGITVANLAARVLPTEQHAFLKPTLPGEGDSFDYLQMSAVWGGTPVYVIATTQDGVWDLVLTPDVLAWVKSEGVAFADQTFLQSWSEAAQKQLVAITKTATPLQDEDGNLLSLAYVGSCFPKGSSSSTMMVPIATQDHHAIIKEIPVTSETSADLPLSLTPHHMADIMDTLIGRPYRWGGIGIDFNNDCSAELKSLFVPFGIYLPRHSSDQVTVGPMTDKSAASAAERLAFLKKEGNPFLSLIYIGGHVILYIGTYPNPNDGGSSMAMTYQNLWGLRPAPPFTDANPDKRFLIGKSVLFPLLLQYPEEPTAVSLAAKQFFQVCDLSEFPPPLLQSSGSFFLRSILSSRHKEPTINLLSLMRPEVRWER